MRIMMRDADNSFDAYRTAQGMEKAGASVFSITHNGMYQPHGALIPSSRMVVWAKVKDDAMIAAVDEAIDKEFDCG